MNNLRDVLVKYMSGDSDMSLVTQQDRDDWACSALSILDKFPVEAMELDLYLKTNKLFDDALRFMNEYSDIKIGTAVKEGRCNGVSPTRIGARYQINLQKFVIWVATGSVPDDLEAAPIDELNPMQVLVTWKERRVYPWVEIDMEGEDIVGVNKVGELIQMLMMEPNVSDVRVQKIKEC